MKIPEIGGAYAAMMTPFGEGGRLNPSVARDMVAFFVDKGLNGVFAVSNVGEFAAMPLEEKLALTELCCDAAGGRLRVCPGATDFDYDNAVALAKHASHCGADAVVLSAPIYYPYNEEYVEQFISCFLDESPLPVIFYHSPKFAQPVRFAFLLDIMAHPKVAAVKESSGDAMVLLKLMEACRAKGIETSVMLGFEELALTGLVHGARGNITSSGGIMPELMLALVERFRSGDTVGAAALQQSVCRITDEIKRYGFPTGYKIAMKARGFDMRIVKSGLNHLENRYNDAVGPMRQLLEREYALHGMTL